MKTTQLCLSLCALLLMAACSGPSAPSCSDPATVDLVKQIVRKNSFFDSALMLPTDAKLDYSVEAIRTTSTNKETGEHRCEAELHRVMKSVILNTEDKTRRPVVYESSLTDDKKHYVTVRGVGP